MSALLKKWTTRGGKYTIELKKVVGGFKVTFLTNGVADGSMFDPELSRLQSNLHNRIRDAAEIDKIRYSVSVNVT